MSETTDRDTKERRETVGAPGDSDFQGEDGARGASRENAGHAEDAQATRGHERPADDPSVEGSAQEAEVLRNELIRLQEELKEANGRADEMKDRFMRARAELENFRRRAALEADRARESGLDSAVLPVLSVYDDLQRALEAADTADPASIVPGVQSVLATLERNLDALGIRSVGKVGDQFDPDLHEALTSIPTDEAAKADTIAEVFQHGFQKGDRLIRPARVVVYQN